MISFPYFRTAYLRAEKDYFEAYDYVNRSHWSVDTQYCTCISRLSIYGWERFREYKYKFQPAIPVSYRNLLVNTWNGKVFVIYSRL